MPEYVGTIYVILCKATVNMKFLLPEILKNNFGKVSSIIESYLNPIQKILELEFNLQYT